MYTKTLIFLAACAAASQAAFTLPTDGGDGIWIHTVNADGSDKVERVGDIDRTLKAPAPPSAKVRRQEAISNWETGCFESEFMESLDIVRANLNLYNVCNALGGSKIQAHSNVAARAGNAVSSVCSYGGDNTCFGPELQSAMLAIAGACTAGTQGVTPMTHSGNPHASYEGGWAYFADGKRSYQYQFSDDHICPRAGRI